MLGEACMPTRPSEGRAAFPETQNTIPDGDLRILLAQFTTAGTISGTLGVQIIFDAPIGEDYRLPFSHHGGTGRV